MRQIKTEIPDALFLHTIRDGRDVAACLRREGWIKPFPWDRKKALIVAGAHWEWKVRKGRESSKTVAPDYLEVRFEDLVLAPQRTLSAIGRFIEADLDYDRIVQRGLGAVKQPNSSFPEQATGAGARAGRWRTILSQGEIAALEASIGDLLSELGYPLVTENNATTETFGSRLTRVIYSNFFDGKQWLKSNTPLGRCTSTGRLQLK
jgi:hypothetical protein